ncbi:MAG: exodeoxyribonuclease VII large subunit [Treponema sp.]|jgi:exodeoxyribonuclease VII large subunit|nr:exodeoxyribonuclease VII large subunit [Treponema sp.]
METISVSQLTERIRSNLESAFPLICVEGELSNCKFSSTGHLYFTLKDIGAAISAVMFKNRFRYLGFELRDGMLLRVRGNVSVYNQRGTYQIVCESIEVAGSGDILAVLEKRKRDLAAEGLFDTERKKPIPRFPDTVVVISSPTGAAIRDILTILRRRAEGIRVIILPTPVQGYEAAPIIAQRIEQANAWNLADVLIVGRGGGALEDLLPFSEEVVVRAVADSVIPIISAVGHEIDWALCDFAADLRASTPSAAAELVSESRIETREMIQDLAVRLINAMESRLERTRLLIKPFRLKDLEYWFRSILRPRLLRFDDDKEELIGGLSYRIRDIRQRLELAVLSIEAGNPRAILERGFSIVCKENGELVRDAGVVNIGERLIIRPLEGTISAITEKAY